MDPKTLAETLAAQPEWAGLNAYERTKRCCAAYLAAGQRLPGWTTIRDAIGKGSSGDINRGKTDFLADHADQLRLFDGALSGLPEALAPHIRAFWAAAVHESRAALAGVEAAAQQEIDVAVAAREQAEQSSRVAAERCQHLETTLVGVREALAIANTACEAERLARDQVERAFDKTRAGLDEQRVQLQEALEHARKEVQGAVDRLDGVEKHALMEVERVKTESQRRIETLEARLQTLTSERRVEQARWSTQLRELRDDLVAQERATALLTQERNSLAEQLAGARDQAARLLALAELRQNGGKAQRSAPPPRRPRPR